MIKEKIATWSETTTLLEGHDRLEYLMDLAKKPTTMTSERTDDKLIPGCISKIWVDVDVVNSKVSVKYDSDAMITKGIAHVVADCFNESTIDDVKNIKHEDFHALGFVQLLTQQRRNGLGNLINIIINKALQA
tara:strand:+ start:1259 stop:1657 length:399 start_codon:yes stop_codon:yes gene_type:complete